MIDLKRQEGRTEIRLGQMRLCSNNINRYRYNQIRKQVAVLRKELQALHELFISALIQGKRKR